MSKTRIIFITVAAWLAVCPYAAYHYATNTLASPDTGPGYEQDWGFQLLMFCVVRLPWWVVGLLAVVAVEVVMLRPGGGKLR